ncbi:hypothetical protein JQS43_05660 [Natronosporangium hydrolyticum]|uniref:Uncharacterized protein n=1 Tax=Natronosporangium hydrolyticum TaxID=2811111 RepID=A0A895YDE6_9ACTN|nr:hypothetical protein [Natronosporangium hydrolyticum]QSB15824.1 hypothetical protein JQS43_05660 [Natronosporangium hydrolyticum]
MADGARTVGNNNAGAFGFAYLVAAVGAAVYFIGESSGFWGVILAILKALVWPAYLVYGVLDALSL